MSNKWTNIAHKEFYRTKSLNAFNIMHNPKKRTLNQHCEQYVFDDGSMLKIYSTSNKMTCYNKVGDAQAERILFN